MSMILDQTNILAKTKELCAALIEDDFYKDLQANIETFLSNDEAKLQYQTVHELGEELHHKQEMGVELKPQEIKAFEDARDNLFDNPIAYNFMESQRSLEGIQKTVSKYVSMTLDLGRTPSDEEFEQATAGACCGGGGCGSNSCGDGSCSN